MTWSRETLRQKCAELNVSQNGSAEDLRKRYQRAILAAAKQPQGREPDFTKHEMARLLEVLGTADAFQLLISVEKIPERRELDKGLPDPWAAGSHIEVTFNGTTLYDRREDTRALASFDPNNHPVNRAADILKRKWTDIRAQYTIVYARWAASGQNDPEKSFADFTQGT